MNYEPLKKYLEQTSGNEKLLTYDDIEQILGDDLSPGAYEHENWWDDTSTVISNQAEAWLAAGWQVAEANLTNRWVKFVRFQS